MPVEHARSRWTGTQWTLIDAVEVFSVHCAVPPDLSQWLAAVLRR